MKIKVVNLKDYRKELSKLNCVVDGTYKDSFLNSVIECLDEEDVVIAKTFLEGIVGWGIITDKMNCYGYSGIRHPAISIYVKENYRNKKIGFQVLQELLCLFKKKFPNKNKFAYYFDEEKANLFYSTSFAKLDLEFTNNKTLYGWAVIKIK
ncbi:MAG: hypothetical protein HC875_20740 [Anaerolineales bacterium]|nr:hypothetical protein [Anaerolineales bacterium]